MPTRLSQLFVRTLREDPSDAEVSSHRLLVRAGYIRRQAPGIFAWLPLGLRVRAKVERVIREEMAAAGAQEVLFPALLPREPYEATGRWEEYGDGIFRLQDRKGADYLLAPTHEEVFTLLVKDLYSSYKDLPLTIFQIQDKYRDEARPRAGLLRGREFSMKDAYSFDSTDAGLDVSYQAQRDAYERIFARLGLEYVDRAGGCRSHGRIALGGVPAPDADRRGHLRALRRRIRRQRRGVHHHRAPEPRLREADSGRGARHPRHPDHRDASSMSRTRSIRVPTAAPGPPPTPSRTSCSRSPTSTAPGRSSSSGCPATARWTSSAPRWRSRPPRSTPPTESDFEKNPLLVKGYIGPWSALGPVLGEESATGIRYLVDPRVVDGSGWITGANLEGKHVFGLVAGRDFGSDGNVEVAEVKAGDPAPDGSGPVELARGMEIGHVFQLGRKYAEALGTAGARRERQARHRHDGLIRHRRDPHPRGDRRGDRRRQGSALARRGRPVRRARDRHRQGRRSPTTWPRRVTAELESVGKDVLYDDRPKVSPGVKFGDAELLGVPTIVIVGRGAPDGVVELWDRRSGERREVPAEGLIAELVAR